MTFQANRLFLKILLLLHRGLGLVVVALVLVKVGPAKEAQAACDSNLSPVVLPRLGLKKWTHNQCNWDLEEQFNMTFLDTNGCTSNLDCASSVNQSINLGTTIQATPAFTVQTVRQTPSMQALEGAAQFFVMDSGNAFGFNYVAIPPPSVSSGNGTPAGPGLIITGVSGGGTTDAGGRTAGAGGPVSITSGGGGDAPVGSTCGTGSFMTLSTGSGHCPSGGTRAHDGDMFLIGRRINTAGELQLQKTGSTLTITADNQAVDLENSFGIKTYFTVIDLNSDNATAANRTFTISNPSATGLLLIIHWSAVTNQGQLQDAGNCKLAGDWNATTQDSTITLLSISTATWVELARSIN